MNKKAIFFVQQKISGTSEINELLRPLFQEVSRYSLGLQCKVTLPELMDDEIDPSQESELIISRIVLMGKLGRIAMKCYVNAGRVSPWLALGLQITPAEVTKALATDFSKELSNLIGGTVKNILNECGIDFGMGLPLILLRDPSAAANTESGAILKWAVGRHRPVVHFAAETTISDETPFREASDRIRASLVSLNMSNQGHDPEFL